MSDWFERPASGLRLFDFDIGHFQVFSPGCPLVLRRLGDRVQAIARDLQGKPLMHIIVLALENHFLAVKAC
ncbi:MAG TPA: hypothetical protein VGD69_09710, partial [Herpetosiphonaceae bacterium]